MNTSTHYQLQAIARPLLLIAPVSILVACAGTGQHVTDPDERIGQICSKLTNALALKQVL